MPIYGGDNLDCSRMKIHGGESEMSIDVWSMVVNLKQMLIDENLWWWIWNAHRCLIYGGEKLKQMLINENLWWWIWNAHRCLIHGDEIWNAHRCPIYGDDNLESPRMKIHGGEITEMPIDANPWWWYRKKGDALNKVTIGGCPKQTDGRGMP